MHKEWPLWEVFIRSQHGLAHRHVGSLHAPDAEMAIKNARDVYTRRNEGVSIWAGQGRRHRGQLAQRQGADVRAGQQQGLPAPDLLRDPREAGPHVMEPGQPLFEYLLRLGDNCLVLGHRLSEWCGHAPVLEEDIALANVALDLIGQAQFWLTLAGEVEGAGRDADRLAYFRDAGGYRNLLLVEQKNGDFAVTMTRQFFFDAWHYLFLSEQHRSLDPRLAEIAAKALKEVAYHLERSRDWIVRLGDGTEESHRRAQRAVDLLWPFTGEAFELDDVDRALLGPGIAVDVAALRQPWLGLVGATLDEATLARPDPDAWMQKGGKRGRHSEHLGYLLAEMQFVQRAYPGASW